MVLNSDWLSIGNVKPEISERNSYVKTFIYEDTFELGGNLICTFTNRNQGLIYENTKLGPINSKSVKDIYVNLCILLNYFDFIMKRYLTFK